MVSYVTWKYKSNLDNCSNKCTRLSTSSCGSIHFFLFSIQIFVLGLTYKVFLVVFKSYNQRYEDHPHLFALLYYSIAGSGCTNDSIKHIFNFDFSDSFLSAWANRTGWNFAQGNDAIYMLFFFWAGKGDVAKSHIAVAFICERVAWSTKMSQRWVNLTEDVVCWLSEHQPARKTTRTIELSKRMIA